jgi:excisionase family DNA binding protein
MSDLLTVSEAATELRISRSEVFALAEQGKLSAVQVGASDKFLFRRDELANVYKPVPASTFRAAREKLSSRMVLARSHRAIEAGLRIPNPTIAEKTAAISSARGE